MPRIPVVSKKAVAGKRVLMRVDFDVAIESGTITEDFRIQANMPSMRFVLASGGFLRLVAHRGRPNGVRQDEFSLAPIAAYCEKFLKRKVIFIRDPFDAVTMQKYGDSREVLLFENIRFWKEEEKNDLDFAQKIARWGEVYVNEAFANSHRAHASVDALARILPAYAGLHLAEEIHTITALLQKSKHPFVVVLGGAKLETKLPLITRFVRHADAVLVGGMLANTLLAARGYPMGKSKVERDATLLSSPALKSKKIILPQDVTIIDAFTREAGARTVAIDKVPQDMYVGDIGPKTALEFAKIISKAATIIWNGPLGYAELAQCRKGTATIAKAITESGAFSVIGGGDSIEALGQLKMLNKFSFISTGGGAMLEFLSGKKLPGIEALKARNIVKR